MDKRAERSYASEQIREAKMRIARASALFPVPPEAAWDFVFGERLSRSLAASGLIAAVDDYRLRADGTPRYTMTLKLGPVRIRGTSDYSVFERPRRTVNAIEDNPIGGTFFMDFEPVADGTRLTEQWHAEGGRVRRAMLRLTGPLLSKLLQRDLDRWARAAAGA